MDGFLDYLIGAVVSGVAAVAICFRSVSESFRERDQWRWRCLQAEENLRRQKDAIVELYALREQIEDAIEACAGPNVKVEE